MGDAAVVADKYPGPGRQSRYLRQCHIVKRDDPDSRKGRKFFQNLGLVPSGDGNWAEPESGQMISDLGEMPGRPLLCRKCRGRMNEPDPWLVARRQMTKCPKFCLKRPQGVICYRQSALGPIGDRNSGKTEHRQLLFGGVHFNPTPKVRCRRKEVIVKPRIAIVRQSDAVFGA